VDNRNVIIFFLSLSGRNIRNALIGRLKFNVIIVKISTYKAPTERAWKHHVPAQFRLRLGATGASSAQCKKAEEERQNFDLYVWHSGLIYDLFCLFSNFFFDFLTWGGGKIILAGKILSRAISHIFLFIKFGLNIIYFLLLPRFDPERPTQGLFGHLKLKISR
jgi:hypothetical protein